MINTKKIYNSLLNNTEITALVPEENIMSTYPNVVTIYPSIFFLDENQADTEYYENKPGASSASVQIHVFSKKLDGYVTTSEISAKIAEVMNNDLWHCSKNGEISDPDPNVEHRVLIFSKSIFIN